jgi:hypothetical protein
MRSFIQRDLDPADRLDEIRFDLIIALGFTAVVRLGTEEPDSRELFVAILGCNLAWGVVDGVMFAMLLVVANPDLAVRLSNLNAPAHNPIVCPAGSKCQCRAVPSTSDFNV